MYNYTKQVINNNGENKKQNKEAPGFVVKKHTYQEQKIIPLGNIFITQGEQQVNNGEINPKGQLGEQKWLIGIINEHVS
jgi:hypothetical protein